MSREISDGSVWLDLRWPEVQRLGGMPTSGGVSEMLAHAIALCASLPRRTVDLQVLLDRGRSEIYRHVARGVELGLIEGVAPLRGVEALVIATGDGHAFTCTGLPQVRISPGQITHAVACSAVAARLFRAHPERPLISDAELRREEAFRGRPIASAVRAKPRAGSACIVPTSSCLEPSGPRRSRSSSRPRRLRGFSKSSALGAGPVTSRRSSTSARRESPSGRCARPSARRTPKSACASSNWRRSHDEAPTQGQRRRPDGSAEDA